MTDAMEYSTCGPVLHGVAFPEDISECVILCKGFVVGLWVRLGCVFVTLS